MNLDYASPGLEPRASRVVPGGPDAGSATRERAREITSAYSVSRDRQQCGRDASRHDRHGDAGRPRLRGGPASAGQHDPDPGGIARAARLRATAASSTCPSRAALGKPERVAYSATKAGLIGMTRTLAMELGGDGITVNAVAPGPIATELFRNSNPEGAPQTQRIIDSIVVKRLGTPRMSRARRCSSCRPTTASSPARCCTLRRHDARQSRRSRPGHSLLPIAMHSRPKEQLHEPAEQT